MLKNETVRIPVVDGAGMFHAIYRTERADYCRQLLSQATSYEEAVAEAVETFRKEADATARRVVGSFIIEYW
jgi:hypothetical protein